MKTTIKLLIVLALALTTFMQHSTASAANVFLFRGKTAQAFFTSVEGCVQTDVFVSASESASKDPPRVSDSGSGVFLYILQYDFCTGTFLIFGSNVDSLEENEFEISNKLNSATLNATVNFFDSVSNTSFDLSMDLTWTGIGRLTRDMDTFHGKSEGCIVNSRFKGTSRLAEASGTVSYGSTNFTPEPAVNAGLFSAKDGTVAVGCF